MLSLLLSLLGFIASVPADYNANGHGSQTDEMDIPSKKQKNPG